MIIPSETVYSFRKGDNNAGVYAVQKGLNFAASAQLKPDGDFGDKTEEAVKKYQRKFKLYVDGLFGPVSSVTLSKLLQSKVTVTLPKGVASGIISGESGNYIGAVNWSTVGGVDCSYVQKRVYESDYNDDDVVKLAFNPRYQIFQLGRNLRLRFDYYLDKPGVKGNVELAWRLSVLYHNYQVLASNIAINGVKGLSKYFTTPQSWVVDSGVKFADGTLLKTPLEWGEHYSLGNSVHNDYGFMVKEVVDWNVT